MHACQYVHVSCDRWSYVYLSMQPDLIGPLSDHGVTRPPQRPSEKGSGHCLFLETFSVVGTVALFDNRAGSPSQEILSL